MGRSGTWEQSSTRGKASVPAGSREEADVAKSSKSPEKRELDLFVLVMTRRSKSLSSAKLACRADRRRDSSCSISSKALEGRISRTAVDKKRRDMGTERDIVSECETWSTYDDRYESAVLITMLLAVRTFLEFYNYGIGDRGKDEKIGRCS